MNEETGKLLTKAESAVRAAQILFGVHAAFGKEFAKTGLLNPKYHGWLLRAFDQRIEGDYQADTKLTADEVATTLERAREFLATARNFLVQADQPPSETTDT